MIIDPQNVRARIGSNYPQQFQPLVAGRIKKRLGNFAGLKNFGVNWVTLKPGSCSALRHWHSKQDEFIYIVSGEATLITNDGEQKLTSGMAAGFPAGEANGHHLVNRSDGDVIYLEIGVGKARQRHRTPQDYVTYPDNDLVAVDDNGSWKFTHKDDSPYDE